MAKNMHISAFGISPLLLSVRKAWERQCVGGMIGAGGGGGYFWVQVAQQGERDDGDVSLREYQLQGDKGAMVETPLAVLACFETCFPASKTTIHEPDVGVIGIQVHILPYQT